MEIVVKYDKNSGNFSIQEKGSEFSVSIGDTFNTEDEDFVYLSVAMLDEETPEYGD
jgi:hypothetical protein